MSTSVARPQEVAEPSRTTAPADVLAAFSGDIEPVRVPLLYRLGILIVAIAMVLLPLIYIGLIVLVGYGLYFHATHGSAIFAGTRRGKAALLMYLGPLVAGAILLLFMVKPLFARRPKQEKRHTLDPDQEPLLFAFVDRVCRAVGAPTPSRIDVDCQVNASASFASGMWSLFTGKVALTIGLPLTAGLSLRQFAGVLAHEFGHFAQRTGMRLTYIIRSINFWFLRVVYERDAWDQRLVQWSREVDVRIGVVFFVARFLVWLTRRILWALMWVGNVISCFMLRQMEYDADRYEARLAGSDTFEQTALRLHELNAGTMIARSDLSDAWRDGRLADDLPALVVARAAELPNELQEQIRRNLTEEKTALFHTHPADPDRIASARAQRASGIFRLDAPSSVLFHDFEALSKEATWGLYGELFEGKVSRGNLCPVAQLLESQAATQHGHKAIERYFRSRVGPLRPLQLPGALPALPADTELAKQQLRAARERMRDAIPVYNQSFERFDESDTTLLNVHVATALMKAGFAIKAAEFSLKSGTLQAAESARTSAVHSQEQVKGDLERFEADVATRLGSALQLLDTPEVRSSLRDAESASVEVKKLYPIAAALAAALPQIVPISHRRATLQTLFNNWEGNETSEKLHGEIMSAGSTLRQAVQELGWKLPADRYPFQHSEDGISVAKYVVPGLPPADEVGQVFEAAGEAIDKTLALYYRVLGRLVLIAESVEAALGLEPLPEPAAAPAAPAAV